MDFNINYYPKARSVHDLTSLSFLFLPLCYYSLLFQGCAFEHWVFARGLPFSLYLYLYFPFPPWVVYFFLVL